MNLLKKIKNTILSRFTESSDEHADWVTRLLPGSSMENLEGASRAAAVDSMRALYASNPFAANKVNFTASKLFDDDFSLSSEEKDVEFELNRAVAALGDISSLARQLLIDGDLFFELRFNEYTGRVEPVYHDIKNVSAEDDGYLVREYSGFKLRSKLIAKESAFHIKINASPLSRFGSSALYCASNWLRRYERLLRASIRRVELQNSFAWHVSMENADSAQISERAAMYNTSEFRENLSKGGGIIISNDKENWRALSAGASGGGNGDVLREAKVMAVSGLGMPEYIISSDASNANYSSTKAQDTPFVMMIKDYQNVWRTALSSYISRLLPGLRAKGMIRPLSYRSLLVDKSKVAEYERILNVVEKHELDGGKVKLLVELAEDEAEYSIRFPQVLSSDDESELKVMRDEYELGIVSKRSLAEKRGYDYDKESAACAAE